MKRQQDCKESVRCPAEAQSDEGGFGMSRGGPVDWGRPEVELDSVEDYHCKHAGLACPALRLEHAGMSMDGSVHGQGKTLKEGNPFPPNPNLALLRTHPRGKLGAWKRKEGLPTSSWQRLMVLGGMLLITCVMRSAPNLPIGMALA